MDINAYGIYWYYGVRYAADGEHYYIIQYVHKDVHRGEPNVHGMLNVCCKCIVRYM